MAFTVLLRADSVLGLGGWIASFSFSSIFTSIHKTYIILISPFCSPVWICWWSLFSIWPAVSPLLGFVTASNTLRFSFCDIICSGNSWTDFLDFCKKPSWTRIYHSASSKTAVVSWNSKTILINFLSCFDNFFIFSLVIVTWMAAIILV